MWNVDSVKFSPWKSAAEILLLQNPQLDFTDRKSFENQKKIHLEHKSLIYWRNNITNIPSKQFYISWSFHSLDMWQFWPKPSCSQKVRFLKVCRTDGTETPRQEFWSLQDGRDRNAKSRILESTFGILSYSWGVWSKHLLRKKTPRREFWNQLFISSPTLEEFEASIY